VNRIKSLLTTQGVKVKAIDGSFKSQLQEKRRWDGTPLRMGLINRVLLEYERLLLARAQISAIEKERRRLLKESESPASHAAWKLSQLKAIGMNGSWVYATEMFGWRKFNNRKKVGSVTGLTGTHYRSGTEWRELGIDKAGNKRVRGIAVEIARCWVRYQPKSDLTLWFQERFGAGGKRLRKIGIVALARKLTIALWRWIDQDVVPEGAVLK
jgi:transposase